MRGSIHAMLMVPVLFASLVLTTSVVARASITSTATQATVSSSHTATDVHVKPCWKYKKKKKQFKCYKAKMGKKKGVKTKHKGGLYQQLVGACSAAPGACKSIATKLADAVIGGLIPPTKAFKIIHICGAAGGAGPTCVNKNLQQG